MKIPIIVPKTVFSEKFKMQANRKLLDELMGRDRDGVQTIREVTVIPCSYSFNVGLQR